MFRATGKHPVPWCRRMRERTLFVVAGILLAFAVAALGWIALHAPSMPLRVVMASPPGIVAVVALALALSASAVGAVMRATHKADAGVSWT